ncbi:hypothetical protein CR513_36814, partial [Mucuna pruriens]
MCVDYRDLNCASPKDNFPLPHIDVLVDNTAQHTFFSFMDGFSRYNQILMALEDQEKTTFITLWGTFCYKVMSFRLKNAGATYQRAIVALFHDMMHKEIEVYVDNMIAKSKTAEQHIDDLLRKYKLRLNPAKCTFGVKAGKLLGSVVNEKEKVKAIKEMPIPPTDSKIRGFLGRQAFEKIKEYLENPPILVPAIPKRPLILYLTILEESMGYMLGQHDDTGKNERVIYYLSKKFTDCEKRYPALERICCALVWAAKRLKQYMLSHTVWLVAKTDHIKYIFEKPALTG